MRKLIDVLAVTSFLVSASVVGGGVYLYTQKDALVEKARERATEAITDIVSGALVDGLSGGITEQLPSGGGLPIPSSPAGAGLPIPF